MVKSEGRGKLLTAFIFFWIFLNTLHFLFITIIDFPPGMQKLLDELLFKNQPSWYKYFILLNSVLDIIVLIGIWMLRKWAVYVYFGTALATTIIPLFTTQNLNINLYFQGLGYTVALLLFAYAIIRRRWHLFM